MNSVLATQFIRFTGVGAVGTAAHYATLILLVELGAVWPTLASGVGFVVGALVNYTLNRSFTFRSEVSHLVGLPKFFAIASVGAIINTGLFYLFFSVFSLHYLVAQIFATAIVLVWNFLGNRYWTFSDAR